MTPRYIADRLAISPRSLYRKMEEIGEDSPTDLIKECRLHIAKDLLLTMKKTIDEIVFDSGFSNKVTFFKVFREKYECTPKEFRMKHLEEVQQKPVAGNFKEKEEVNIRVNIVNIRAKR